MSSNKTDLTDASVGSLSDFVENGQKRRDSRDMIAMMTKITGHEPRMWGGSLAGFGRSYSVKASRAGTYS